MTDAIETSGLLAFGLVLVFALALSWIWIIFGMKVKTPGLTEDR